MHSLFLLFALCGALAVAIGSKSSRRLYSNADYITSCQHKYLQGNGMWSLEPVLVTSWAQLAELNEQNAIKLQRIHKRILECIADKKLAELRSRAPEGERLHALVVEEEYYSCSNGTKYELAICVYDLLEEFTGDDFEDLSRGRMFGGTTVVDNRALPHAPHPNPLFIQSRAHPLLPPATPQREPSPREASRRGPNPATNKAGGCIRTKEKE
jgi:hypothetical protein